MLIIDRYYSEIRLQSKILVKSTSWEGTQGKKDGKGRYSVLDIYPPQEDWILNTGWPDNNRHLFRRRRGIRHSSIVNHHS